MSSDTSFKVLIQETIVIYLNTKQKLVKKLLTWRNMQNIKKRFIIEGEQG